MFADFAPLALLTETTYVNSVLSGAQRLGEAGLIDLDATIITQGLFFIVLLLALPGLVYKPMLARFDEREARTDGARADAKALRRQADDEVSRYETAIGQQRRDALTERAETRTEAQREADIMVATARQEATDRVNAGIASQRSDADRVRGELKSEVQLLAAAIAAKIVRN